MLAVLAKTRVFDTYGLQVFSHAVILEMPCPGPVGQVVSWERASSSRDSPPKESLWFSVSLLYRAQTPKNFLVAEVAYRLQPQSLRVGQQETRPWSFLLEAPH